MKLMLRVAMHTALISFHVYEKAESIKKIYIATGYKIWGNSRTLRFPWVPNNQT